MILSLYKAALKPCRTFGISITMELSFGLRRLSIVSKRKADSDQITRYADMFGAMGTESRLRIMQLLLTAHPDGLVVGEIGRELDIPNSTHHLEKLRAEDLVRVRREGTFLWYSANTGALQELLGFLYAECCTRNKAVEPRKIVCGS
jgi:ArsR family transcriptional regulator, arsenate/arsenite/antimonite-responsive transcriptional repressor